jgi:hypothetical protein
MSTDFANPATTADEIPRDRWGRPLVVPPGGGKPVGYMRCTTFASTLEDTYNLARWQQRMVAIGLVDRPDLQLAVAAHRDDKSRLNDLCNEALDAAAAKAAATTGTALHALTEQHDRGTLDIAKVPLAYRPDIEAYVDATRALEVVQIETFGVVDDMKIGGTWDRIVSYNGRNVIADLKTGSVDYGMLKIAVQLAIYSRCVAYNFATHDRTPLPDVDQDVALVIHLPAGTGTARLLEVDIAAGWQAVDCARKVRGWRAKNNFSRVVEQVVSETRPAESVALLEQIGRAGTVDDLTALWRTHAHEWTEQHTAAATDRKTALVGTSGKATERATA